MKSARKKRKPSADDRRAKPAERSGSPFEELFGEAASTAPWMQSAPFSPPISDPFKEKQVFEKRGDGAWTELVREQTGARGLAIPPGEEWKRIAEVYRLCFERSAGTDLGVVADFVAHCPRVVLGGTWLSSLVKRPLSFSYIDPNTNQNRLLKAISNGFRRAASSIPRTRASVERALLSVRLDSAREMQREIKLKLDEFLQRLDPSHAETTWLKEEIEKKCRELVALHPHLSALSETLREHLRKKRAYKASVLIAATVFRVRERDLEAKID